LLHDPVLYSRLLQAYRRYKDGFLPEPGAIGNQPNLLIEYFDELSAITGVLDQEDIDRSNSNNNSSNGNGDWVSVREGS